MGCIGGLDIRAVTRTGFFVARNTKILQGVCMKRLISDINIKLKTAIKSLPSQSENFGFVGAVIGAVLGFVFWLYMIFSDFIPFISSLNSWNWSWFDLLKEIGSFVVLFFATPSFIGAFSCAFLLVFWFILRWLTEPLREKGFSAYVSCMFSLAVLILIAYSFSLLLQTPLFN